MYRNFHTVFQSDCIILYSQHQNIRVSVAPNPMKILYCLSFFCILNDAQEFARGHGMSGKSVSTKGVSRVKVCPGESQPKTFFLL